MCCAVSKPLALKRFGTYNSMSGVWLLLGSLWMPLLHDTQDEIAAEATENDQIRNKMP